jgi:probable lipoprotein NlpC
MAGATHDTRAVPRTFPVKHWSSHYIGLPWLDLGRDRAGVDCWGLPRLIYAQEKGIDLPSYTGAWTSANERAEIAAIVAADSKQWPWTSVAQNSEREFDLALFRRGGDECHIGTIVERGRMLHVVEGSESSVEPYDRGRWKIKLIGIYRHAALL